MHAGRGLQLVRTAGDMFRLVPFIIIVIVPFAEFALPVLLRFFPNMLPSTFEHDQAKEEKKTKLLNVRLQMAKFFQDAIEDMAVHSKNPASAQRFTTLLSQVRVPAPGCAGSWGPCALSAATRAHPAAVAIRGPQLRTDASGGSIDSGRVIEFSRLFGDELTLDNLSRPQLLSLTKFMNLTGTAHNATPHPRPLPGR